jgi:hypothetical protein
MSLHEKSFKEKKVEADQPQVGYLTMWFTVLGILFIAVIIFVVYFFRWEVRREIFKKELSVPNNELQMIEERDKARLTIYDVIDSDKGIYQIPIDVVIEQLSKNPTLIAPIKP